MRLREGNEVIIMSNEQEGHIVDAEMERVRATLKAYEELKQKQHDELFPKPKEPRVKNPRNPRTHQTKEEMRASERKTSLKYDHKHKEQVNLVNRFHYHGCVLCGSRQIRLFKNMQLTRKDNSRLYFCNDNCFQTWAREHNLVYVIDNTKQIGLGLNQFIIESK